MIDGDELMSHWDYLCAYVRKRLPDADPAMWEDIAAGAIEKALTKYEDRGHADGLKRWLATVARNAVLDYQRYRAGRELPLIYDTFLRRGRLDAGSEQHVTILDVRTAVEGMAPAEREIVWRHGALGYTQAEATGRPRSTASRRFRAASAPLREVLAS